jgi:hypothetical protein
MRSRVKLNMNGRGSVSFVNELNRDNEICSSSSGTTKGSDDSRDCRA